MQSSEISEIVFIPIYLVLGLLALVGTRNSHIQRAHILLVLFGTSMFP